MITINHISKTFGKGNTQVHAVNNLSVSIQEGDFYAITGPSGSGKSTLLQMLGGLLPPDEGEILLDGVNVYSLNENQRTDYRRRHIGFIFQTFNLIPHLNAEENLMLPAIASSCDCSRTAIKNCAQKLMQDLHLLERCKHYPAELSSGEQQRVAIGRGLIMKQLLQLPGGILLADEPTGNLDSASGENVFSLLTQYSQLYGMTLLLVTHDPHLASQAPHRLTMLDGQGQLLH